MVLWFQWWTCCAHSYPLSCGTGNHTQEGKHTTHRQAFTLHIFQNLIHPLFPHPFQMFAPHGLIQYKIHRGLITLTSGQGQPILASCDRAVLCKASHSQSKTWSNAMISHTPVLPMLRTSRIAPSIRYRTTASVGIWQICEKQRSPLEFVCC